MMAATAPRKAGGPVPSGGRTSPRAAGDAAPALHVNLSQPQGQPSATLHAYVQFPVQSASPDGVDAALESAPEEEPHKRLRASAGNRCVERENGGTGSASDLENAERDPAYFNYYGQLQNQQNMLQDTLRTKAYQDAVQAHQHRHFREKFVLDVGAGSGILSFFAAQVGAYVWAVEASAVADKMRTVVESADRGGANSWMKGKITVVKGKIETPGLPIPQVDTIISEPIGVLLVHERMLESYIYARDHYLRPGGAMFPSNGTVYLAPFTDAGLWSETMAKVRFWEQRCFYGVDLSPLAGDARQEMFSMPVVGNFDPRCLMTPEPTTSNNGYDIDFTTVTADELRSFDVPVAWTATYTGIVHGIAGWFDVHFEPAPSSESDRSAPPRITLSTSPSRDRTHWQQVRLLLRDPLAVNAGQCMRGTVHFRANEKRSYSIFAEIELVCGGAATERREQAWELQDQTYNYATAPFVSDEDYRPEHSCMYPPSFSIGSDGVAKDLRQMPQREATSTLDEVMEVPEGDDAPI